MAERNSRGQFVKGNQGGPGRPKGSRNRRPALEEAVVAAFAESGAPPYLARMAREHPDEFVKLLSDALARSIELSRRGARVASSGPTAATQTEIEEQMPPVEPETPVKRRTRSLGFSPRRPEPPRFDTALM